jgi:thiamine biosynthesis lipoprotein
LLESPFLRFLLLSLFLFLPTQALAEWHRESREMMGTRVDVELWSEDAGQAEKTIAEAMAALQRVDWMMNPLDPESELSRVNADAFTAPVRVSEELYEVVEKALYYSRLSGGAFDISFASIGQFYDYRAGQSPSDELVAENRDRINFRAIVLDAEKKSIAFTIDGLQLDLGGIAKGFAVDRGIEVLARAGIVAGFVSAGGDSRVLGDYGDRPRMIGIKHPRKKDEFAVMIPLSDTAISTSGDYERFFMEGETRVHHILDPQTGRSSGKVQSVSVLTAHAIDSDALSTTTFVLGVERGLALVNSLPGVEAIIIDAGGRLHYSTGLLREAIED